MKPDKNGQLVCNVCGEGWHDHNVGGNCKQPPVPVVKNA